MAGRISTIALEMTMPKKVIGTILVLALLAMRKGADKGGAIFDADFPGPGDVARWRPGCVGSCRFPGSVSSPIPISPPS